MRKLLSIAAFVSIFGNHFAQEQVRWGSYFLGDTIAESALFSLDNHTSIYPHIANRRTDSKHDSVKSLHQNSFNLFPAIDAVGGVSANRFDIRTGIGFGMEYAPLRGMHIQLGYVGGLGNRDVVNYTGGAYTTSYFRFQNNGYTTMQYHDVRGRVSYSPNKFFNFQVGIDQNKFGEGDRSLFLDDYGTPYPFAMMRMKVWRAEYVILHQLLREHDGSGGYFRKHAATHYLSLNLFKGFNFSFFETVIYSGKAGSQSRPFEVEYLNPFILYRPVEYGLGSSDKVQIGAQLAYKVSRGLQWYGQVLFDEFLLAELRAGNGWWANKFAVQFGFKGVEPLGLKGASYLTELNFARPYTYTHGNIGQSFTHQGTMLAHPYGANFAEWNSRLRWTNGKWDVNADVVYALRGGDFDDSISWGGDILQSYNNRPDEYGFYIGNGDKYNITKLQVTTGYLISQKWRLRAFVTAEMLWVAREGHTNNYFGGFVGLRTELWNDRRNY